MRCEVILIVRIFYNNHNTNDICLRFLPPSSTGTIARVRVSMYVGGVHEDLTSLSPNPGGVSEVAVSRSKGAGRAPREAKPLLGAGNRDALTRPPTNHGETTDFPGE